MDICKKMKKMVMLTKVNGFSGIVGPLLHALDGYWEIVAKIDPFQISLPKKFSCAITSFNIIQKTWRYRYYKCLENYKRSFSAFNKRTKLCKKKLSYIDEDYDLIFQFSHMFMASTNKPSKPYIIYLDRTMKMYEWHFPDVFESMETKEKEELYHSVKLALSLSDRVFTFNDVTRNSVVNDYNINCDKVVTVGSGVNIEVLPHIEKHNSKLVISVCSDFDRHNGRLSLEAMEIARNKIPNATFIFVGDYPREIGNQIRFIPFLPYDKLTELYAKASVVIMPTSLGGMQTIAEAMACRCACIAYAKNPYVSGLIIDKENGFLFSKEEPLEIANMITMVLNDPELMESVGRTAQSYILKKYTWENVALRITKHIEEFI